MKKRWVALIALVSLTVGAWGASWFWLSFNAEFMNHNFVAGTEADIVTKVAVLEHMRAGRIKEATTLLETLLDGNLISAAALSREGTKFKANTLRALGLESQARTKTGYAPADGNVLRAVQEALQLAPTTNAAQPIVPANHQAELAGSQWPSAPQATEPKR